jgi:predicted RNA-binding protein
MCELKVVIEKNVVFEDAIYATTTGNSVVVKDIMGKSKEFKNHTVI